MRESAIDKINKIDSRFGKITALRHRANALIEEHIPLIWKDGDVRYLSSEIFQELIKISDEIDRIEFEQDADNVKRSTFKKKLTYIGQFGCLELRNAEDKSEL